MKVWGIILTVIITFGFIWAAFECLQGNVIYKKPKLGSIPWNEVKAFGNIKKIAEAQERYIEKDWDGDNVEEYAAFYVHLWQSVDKDAYPVQTRLISEELANAMVETQSLNGYYFKDLVGLKLSSEDGEKAQVKVFDYEDEWGVVALPKRYGETGRLAFLVDASGTIYARDAGTDNIRSKYYPHEPEKNGWKEVSDTDEL